jgi:DNA (cytosine-5)-methyltransferase 1
VKKYKIIDLFCGIGGFSYGFEMTKRFEVVVAADIWNVALDTFKLNHTSENIDIIQCDLTQTPNDFWKKYNGLIDVIIAGPPCQGFSMSGKREIGDKRNSLFEEVIRVTSITNPKFVVVENVVGLLSMTDGNGQLIKDLIVEEFNKIGYKVEYKVLTAADYGVPQMRKRVIFVATKNLNFSYPKPILSSDKYITVGDALGNIDPVGDKYFKAKTDYQQLMKGSSDIIQNHEKRISKDFVVERMKHIPQGGNWRNIPKELGTGGGVHSNAYKRLDPNKPSITIKHAAKAMIIHPTENRLLTIREVARLQSFNDDFVFAGSITNQHQQLANAVPPLLGQAIALQVLEGLDNKI